MIFDFAGSEKHVAFCDTRGLGVVRLLSDRHYVEQLGAAKLGPDALEITPEGLAHRLGTSRRAVKVALLDQRVVAGIGNIYASEMLHRAGIHPATPCNQLQTDDWVRLHTAMREVLLEAIRLEGSTLRDGAYRNAQGRSGGFQDLHRVYQRDGMQCLQCASGEIARVVLAQRSTFFCPGCQPRRGL
jgi:formamidopyrimidine-DNA glycosylase